MHHPWLEHYSSGVPWTIELQPHSSVAELIASACRRFAPRRAFEQDGEGLSYAEFDELANRFAAWIQHASGLERGQRIALMMPNVLSYPIALAGALRAGLVVVNVNPLYTAHELEHHLVDSGAAAIVAFEDALPALERVRGATALRHELLVGPRELQYARPHVPSPLHGTARFAHALAAGAKLPFDMPRIGPDDLAFLQYTGGTTGVSKAAMLTHGNVTANVLQGAAWYARGFAGDQPVAVSIIPLYHAFGMTFNCLLTMHVGALNRLVANPRSTHQLRAALSPGLTVLAGVNTLFNTLLELPEMRDVDYSALRLTVSGGAATQPVVASRWHKATGCPIIEGYGLTEASPFALSNPVHVGMCGGLLPLPSTEAEIRSDDGVALPEGQPGEICVRGPQVMRGYWRQLEATDAAIDADGWLRTGDIGVMDSRGAVCVTDRKKDMVLVSGFNVFPNEVEAVLAGHEGVVECAVVGVPDKRTGEAVKAFVVLRDPAPSVAALAEHCRESLAPYKVPRHFQVVDLLPKSPVGKILRRELRARG